MSSTPASARTAVVLLSGGLDSATTLAIARSEGYACHALSFDYGQRHRGELDAARAVAHQLGVASHRWAQVDLRTFGGSALTADLAVPKDRDEHQMAEDIPITYVPARNTIFLSYALALAEVLEAQAIFVGVNAVDYSGYPDCRPQFVQAFQTMADLATRAGVEGHGPRLQAPLIHLTKSQIIAMGLALGVDYSLTHSCYDPIAHDGRDTPCQRCDACRLRITAFEKLGQRDPTLPAPSTGRP